MICIDCEKNINLQVRAVNNCLYFLAHNLKATSFSDSLGLEVTVCDICKINRILFSSYAKSYFVSIFISITFPHYVFSHFSFHCGLYFWMSLAFGFIPSVSVVYGSISVVFRLYSAFGNLT